MNMWMLWIFGDDIEDVMGRFRFLLFYFFSGVGANLVGPHCRCELTNSSNWSIRRSGRGF